MRPSEDRGLEVDSADPEQNARINERDGHSPFPIVGIGASAGGLDAFQQLLGQLPVDINMAFLLVQHLDATHESHLTHILSRATRLPVLEANHGGAVRAGPVAEALDANLVTVVSLTHYAAMYDVLGQATDRLAGKVIANITSSP